MNEEELRTLDAEVHGEVMGAKWFLCRWAGDYEQGNAPPYVTDLHLHLLPQEVSGPNLMGWIVKPDDAPDPGRPSGCPNYSTDITAAWYMEEEIQRRGLTANYGVAMTYIILETCFTANAQHTYYDLLHASPEQRCRAALLTVREASRMKDARMP